MKFPRILVSQSCGNEWGIDLAGSVEMEVVCSTKVPEQPHYTTQFNDKEDHYLNKTHSKNLKTCIL